MTIFIQWEKNLYLCGYENVWKAEIFLCFVYFLHGDGVDSELELREWGGKLAGWDELSSSTKHTVNLVDIYFNDESAYDAKKQ